MFTAFYKHVLINKDAMYVCYTFVHPQMCIFNITFPMCALNVFPEYLRL